MENNFDRGIFVVGLAMAGLHANYDGSVLAPIPRVTSYRPPVYGRVEVKAGKRIDPVQARRKASGK